MKKKYTALIILFVIIQILPWAALVGGVAVVNHIAKTGDLVGAYYEFSDSIMDAISNPPDFKYYETTGGNYGIAGINLIKYDKKSGQKFDLIYISFRVPSKYNGKPVVEILGLSNLTELKSVSLPNTIVTISAGTFSRCYSLMEINFPKSISFIGSYAFTQTALTEVNLSGDIKTIDINAFAHCSKLEKVSIKGKNVVIKAQAFDGCTSLKEVSLVGVETIGEGAFKGCLNLRTVTMSNDVKYIFDNVFAGCIYLDRIDYLGTAEEWHKITKNNNWATNVSVTVYCSDGTVIEY